MSESARMSAGRDPFGEPQLVCNAARELIGEGAPNHPTTPGEVIALEKVRMKVRLEHHGNQLSGTLLDEILDMRGNVIFLAPGTYEATRISVEPLP